LGSLIFFISFAPDFLHQRKMSTPILTITGSDGTGISGVQADIRFIHELGGQAVSAITSITVQNTLGIQHFYDLPAEIVRQQVEAIVNDLQPQVVKIGLLRRADVVEALADVLRRYKPQHVVYAPVLHSSKGELLVAETVFKTIEKLLMPLCTVVLTAKDVTFDPRRHGQANQLGSAVAYYLSIGETDAEAMQHAKVYLSQNPAGYTGGNSRSEELYNLFVASVEQYFRHYADVTFYAEQLNVSPRYLGQVTRRVSGRSPKSIIDERIVTEVAAMLTASHCPLKEVAQRLGFSSQAHLSRFFKKHKGVSPTEYQHKKLQ
jgi:hydroxymethylpyrimidine/phosphomethylpyrimidine kinase